MTGIFEMYHWLFTTAADDRVKDWMFMGGPGWVLLLLAAYLYSIKVAIPNYMKNRAPYDLKSIIKAYNIFQVIANSILSWGFYSWGFKTAANLGCNLPDSSDTSEEAMTIAGLLWWTVMLKAVELVETVFFVLRKKDNQASFLHVYHHCVTLFVLWIATKFVPGGMACFTPMLNTFVHVIMYSYYLLATEAGPELRQKLNKWKKWLTVVQMTQFIIILLHSLQAVLPSCEAPRIIAWLVIPNVVLVYYLFNEFFKNAYGDEQEQQRAKGS